MDHLEEVSHTNIKKVVSVSSQSSKKKIKRKRSKAERKKLKKEKKRKLKRAKKRRQYERLADDAKKTLQRSRSEATTILLEGLQESEWDVINDSFLGLAKQKSDGTVGINRRKEPFSAKFCRWFELISLLTLWILGLLCFLYFSYRYEAPFEICVCAERRLRNCAKLSESNLVDCQLGQDDNYDQDPYDYLNSACEDSFGDDMLNMNPWQDISNKSFCFRDSDSYDYDLCDSVCYQMNSYFSREDPHSIVDRQVREAYGLPEYMVRWVNREEADSTYANFELSESGERFTHMWAFRGTYPTYVTYQKSYFFAIVFCFALWLFGVSLIETIKGYDPKKKNAAVIAGAIMLVLLSLFIFAVYILIGDNFWLNRYRNAVESVGKVLNTSSESIIAQVASFQPTVSLNESFTSFGAYPSNPPNERLIIKVDSGDVVLESETTDLLPGDVVLEEGAILGLLIRAWLPYIIEPCLNYLTVNDNLAASLIVGLDITAQECQCNGFDCEQCPPIDGSSTLDLLYADDGICEQSAVGDWVCPSNTTTTTCQSTMDSLRTGFHDARADMQMTITTDSVPLMALLIFFSAIRYLNIIAFTIRMLRYRAEQCYNCHTGFNAGKWPFKCKQCGYNFCETCLAHQRLLAANDAHVKANATGSLSQLLSKAARTSSDGENGRIEAFVCGSCFQKTPANTLNMLTNASISQNCAEGIKLLSLFHYDDCMNSWRITQAKALGINIQGKDEHGEDRVKTAAIPPPERDYIEDQVLMRIRRETGVFWYTGLDRVISKAIHSMYDYYSLKGGILSFNELIARREDEDNDNDSPVEIVRRRLLEIFPITFDRDINAAIALDSVQQSQYKQIIHDRTAYKNKQVIPAVLERTKSEKKALSTLGAVSKTINLEVLDFELLQEPLSSNQILYEGGVRDLVQEGNVLVSTAEDNQGNPGKSLMREYWKMSYNNQGDFHQLEHMLSPFGSLYPTYALYLGLSSQLESVAGLPPRAVLAPQTVMCNVSCEFFAHRQLLDGTTKGGVKLVCDLFFFLDFILFFKVKASSQNMRQKKKYRYRSVDKRFLLLREDVGYVEECNRNQGDHAHLVIGSSAHNMVHTFGMNTKEMKHLSDNFYLWLSPTNFSDPGLGTGNYATVRDLQREQLNLRNNAITSSSSMNKLDVEDLSPKSMFGDAFQARVVLNPQTSHECPIRKNQAVKFFISGQEYFRTLAQTLNAAQESIFISSESISPEIYLLRDTGQLQENRLDVLLQRKARAGTVIYISIAKSKYADYVAGRLELLHENVFVMVHNTDSTHDWSAHQNMIVIDSSIAFVGSIPLDFGNFERVQDMPPLHAKLFADQLEKSNSRVSLQMTNERRERENPLQRSQSDFRFPLTDKGERYFPGASFVNPTENGGLYPEHLLEWPFFSQGIFSDINARKCTPRLPNCQVMIAVLGSVATDLARTFVCQWNACPLNQKPDEPGTISQRMIFDLPTVIPGMDEATFRWVLEQNDPLAIVGLCNARCLRSLSPSYGFANIEASIHDQMLHLISTADRSIHLECSTFISFVTPQNFVHNRIARALFDRISIAIEQDQDFFVVIQLPVQPPALIEKLSTLGEIFFSALSLHHSKDSLLGQLQERYFTIPDNDSDVNNPLSRRSAKGKRITDYLSILTLYKWVHFKDRYKYTGFKKASPMRPANHVACGINVTGTVLIVDDKVALIGSHGVSDRSLLGNRNSESAIVVDDKEIKSITSGFRSDTSVEVGVNVHKFRMRLWNRLLGLPLNDMTTTSNMIAQEVRLLLKHTAKRNTVLFHHVFPALPHHSYRTLQDFNMAILKKRERRPNEQQSTLFLHEIKGVVCHFPVGFLADEDPEGVIGSFGDSLSKTQRQYV